MKRKLLSLALAPLLMMAVWILARPISVARSVSVVFLGYSSCGFYHQFTCASFRLQNDSPFKLTCYQGALAVERAGTWIQDTNQMGYQYDPVLEPGQALTVTIIRPSDGTRWRSSFLLRKMSIHSARFWTVKFRFRSFMNSLRLERFGIRWRPWDAKISKPYVVMSETIEL